MIEIATLEQMYGTKNSAVKNLEPGSFCARKVLGDERDEQRDELGEKQNGGVAQREPERPVRHHGFEVLKVVPYHGIQLIPLHVHEHGDKGNHQRRQLKQQVADERNAGRNQSEYGFLAHTGPARPGTPAGLAVSIETPTPYLLYFLEVYFFRSLSVFRTVESEKN